MQCFHAQTYPDKELIIVDDADDPSFPAERPECSLYILAPKRMRIGEKRNALCREAKGELIAHFDSDDWSDPARLETQVKILQESGKSLTGFTSIYFYEERTHRAALYRAGSAGWIAGTSFLYRREYWERYPFPEQKTYRSGKTSPVITGEDALFSQMAKKDKQAVTIEGLGLMVARVHSDNTSKKNLVDRDIYKPVDISVIPAAFFN